MIEYSGVSFWPTGQTGNQGRVMWCVVGGDLLVPTKRLGLIRIEDGFVFDGVSAPWFILPWVPQGSMFIAAATHDWLTQKTSHDKRTCDAVFYDCLQVCKVPEWVCRIAYFVVRLKKSRD